MVKFKKVKAKPVLNNYTYRDNWRAEFLNIGKSEKAKNPKE